MVDISAVAVRNFRCLRDDTLSCEPLTALVGRNGSGKSSFLRALQLFYSPGAGVTEEDYFNHQTDEPIVIRIEYRDLPEDAAQLFEKYVDGGTLAVEKVIEWNDGRPRATYHGSTLQNPEFSVLRAALDVKDRGASAKEELDRLRDDGYGELPDWSTKDGVAQALKEWEGDHPDRCERRRDEGQFFGFAQVGQGYLGRFTRLLFIPAVRDAGADATEGRKSVFSELMDLVVRSVLAAKPAIQELEGEYKRRIEDALAPEDNPELGGLAEDLTGALQSFVPETKVVLDWQPLQDVSIPLPQADVRLIEDGYPAPVDRCGHGLQRAFVLTMLQRLALAQVRAEADEMEGEQDRADAALPNLVLVIEEPELYQHPNRQRHFAAILTRLANGETPGVADRTQVIYATHSPLFVRLDRIEELRLLRKVQGEDPDLPKTTSNLKADLSLVAEDIWRAAGEPGTPFTADTLRARMSTVMTPWMNEGFFADLVVLVEGEGDRAALLGMAEAMGVELDARGISVIPCHGKNNMDRPAAVFKQLEIPTYLVWDADAGSSDARPEDNHHLLRLIGENAVDWPEGVHQTYACFRRNLNAYLEEQAGEAFDEICTQVQEEVGISKRRHALKNPRVIARVIETAGERAIAFPAIEEILRTITDFNAGPAEELERPAEAPEGPSNPVVSEVASDPDLPLDLGLD